MGLRVRGIGRLALVAALPAVAACSLLFESAGGNADVEPDASALPRDGGPSDGGESDVDSGGAAPDAGPLEGADILARYYLDETNQGMTPASYANSASTNAGPLVVTDGSLAVEGNPGKRGLVWPTALRPDRATAAITNTIIQDNLDGSNTATLEMVLTIQELPLSAQQAAALLFVGSDGGAEQEALSVSIHRPASTGTMVVLGLRTTNSAVSWSVDSARIVGERVAMHLVYDTGLTNEAERVRLYLQGEIVLPAPSTYPEQDTPLSFSSANILTLGNAAPSSSLSMAGKVAYLGIYSSALTSSEALIHAELLLANDDTP